MQWVKECSRSGTRGIVFFCNLVIVFYLWSTLDLRIGYAGAAESEKLWKPGQSLHVRFIGGTPYLQQQVAEYVSEWMRYGNIRFIFDNSPSAEVRVAFNAENAHSVVGTDALLVNQNEATVYLSLNEQSSSDWVRRSILHEFGHVLGMLHEHQHPDANIQWNKPSLYAFLGAPPYHWGQALVDLNFIQTYDRSNVRLSPFDSDSIMMYPIYGEWTLNNTTYNNRGELSAGDRAFIAQIYPYSTQPTPLQPTQEVQAIASQVTAAQRTGIQTVENSRPPASIGLQVGQKARVVNVANLRRTAGLSKKTNRDILIRLQPGQMVKLLTGPTTTDGLRWWQVTWRDKIGWIAEVAPNGTVLLTTE